MRRARMKPGVRPIIVECQVMPEYPTYWNVPDSVSAAVQLLVDDGQVEYEPYAARGANGAFLPAVQVVTVDPAVKHTKAFQKKGPKAP